MLMGWSSCLNKFKSIAGKPAPTGYLSVTKSVITENPVGAGLPAMASLASLRGLANSLYSGKYRLNNARNAAGFTGLGK